MLNLEKLCKVWDDLDYSYRVSSKPGQSKKEFLDFLIGFDREKGVHAIDYLESKLLVEASEYNEEQNKKYRELLEKFRTLRNTYETYMGEINSLNGFIKDHVAYEKSGMARLNNGLISKMQLKYKAAKYKPLVMDLASAYEYTGQLGNCTVKIGNVCQAVRVEDEDAYLYDGSKLTTRPVLNQNYDLPLRSHIANFVSSYMHSHGVTVVDEPFLFLSEKYYSISGERLYLNLGKSKKYIQMKSVEETPDYYVFTKVFDKIKYNIVCCK